MRILIVILIGLVIGIFAIVIGFYFTQDRLIFYPTSDWVTKPDGDDWEDLIIETDDGESLSAWFFPGRDTLLKEFCVLFTHGNGGNISHRIETIDIIRDSGFSLLIYDYRGYGKSTGTPSSKGTYIDQKAVVSYLSNRGFPSEKLILHGRSLGGAMAARAASETSCRGLVLESTFTSLGKLGGEIYPWLPVKPLLRHRYTTLEDAKAVACPILIIHSREDTMIPFHHGEELAAETDAELIEIQGGHNDGFYLSGDLYVDVLHKFYYSVTKI